MTPIRKCVIVTLCAIFFIALVAAITLDQYYSASLPKEPNETSGNVHQLTVSHGSVRYGTQQEIDQLHRVKEWEMIGIVCGIIAGTLNAMYRDFSIFRKPGAHYGR